MQFKRNCHIFGRRKGIGAGASTRMTTNRDLNG